MTLYRSIKLSRALFLSMLLFACSENYDSEETKVLLSEFERTYQHTIENMPIDTSKSYSLEKLKKINSAALISIAYRWHSFAASHCSQNAEPKKPTKMSNYDKLASQQKSAAISFSKISDSSRDCHSLVFFDNWSEIQKMISLNL